MFKPKNFVDEKIIEKIVYSEKKTYKIFTLKK